MTPEELSAAIDALKEVDPKTFSEALLKGASTLYQNVYNAGHKTATGNLKEKLDGNTTEITDLKAQLTAKDEQIVKLGENNPDSAKVIADYEASVQKKDDRIIELESKIDENDTEWTDRFKRNSTDVTLEKLIGNLVREHGVDPRYAKAIVKDPDVIVRLRHDDDGLVSGAVQLDGVAPLPVPDGQTVVDVLSTELAGGVPGKFKEDRRQNESKLGGEGGKKKSFTESEIESMSDTEFETQQDAIDEALAAGRVTAG